MQPVRIGVVGIGNFGRLHARTLAGLGEAQLVAMVDSQATRRDQLMLELPGVRCWADFATALREADAEAWVIATRTETHVPLAEQALASGASVLIEKPLASLVSEAQRLTPLIAPDSRNLMLGHILLFSQEFRCLQEEMRQRSPLIYFHAFRHRPVWTGDYFNGESPFHLTMVHDLYLALALIGGLEPSSVRGRLHRRADGRANLGLAEMTWDNGVWGSFTASYLTPHGMAHDGFDRLELFGEGWAANLAMNPRPLTFWSDRAEWPMALDINADPRAPSGWMAEELRHFCRVVRGQAEVPFGARFVDGLQVMRWLDLLEQSAAQS